MYQCVIVYAYKLLSLVYFFAGFRKPSAIQQHCIVPLIGGYDIIAQAQSGTGKTATFTIALLQILRAKSRETQAIILSPTRELATQIQKVCSFNRIYAQVLDHNFPITERKG